MTSQSNKMIQHVTQGTWRCGWRISLPSTVEIGVKHRSWSKETNQYTVLLKHSLARHNNTCCHHHSMYLSLYLVFLVAKLSRYPLTLLRTSCRSLHVSLNNFSCLFDWWRGFMWRKEKSISRGTVNNSNQGCAILGMWQDVSCRRPSSGYSQKLWAIILLLFVE